MKKTDSTHTDNIELRSPRLRRLIDSIPGSLMLWAVLVPCLILAAMVLALLLVSYPGSEESLMTHLLSSLQQ